MPVMTAHPLRLTPEQRAQLDQMARSGRVPHRKVVQAQALLLAADGVPTNEVARRCGTTDTSVRAWRRRFEAEGVTGWGGSPRAGAGGRGCRRARWPRWCGSPCTSCPTTARRIGRRARLAERFGIGKDTWLGSGGITSSSRGRWTRSRSRTILVSRRSWSTWSGCT